MARSGLCQDTGEFPEDKTSTEPRYTDRPRHLNAERDRPNIRQDTGHRSRHQKHRLSRRDIKAPADETPEGADWDTEAPTETPTKRNDNIPRTTPTRLFGTTEHKERPRFHLPIALQPSAKASQYTPPGVRHPVKRPQTQRSSNLLPLNASPLLEGLHLGHFSATCQPKR